MHTLIALGTSVAYIYSVVVIFMRTFLPDTLTVRGVDGGGVYFDTAASPFLYRPQIFTTVAGLVGPEKILFATDFPLIKHRRAIAQVEEAIPAGNDRDAILGGNAARLFGL